MSDPKQKNQWISEGLQQIIRLAEIERHRRELDLDRWYTGLHVMDSGADIPAGATPERRDAIRAVMEANSISELHQSMNLSVAIDYLKAERIRLAKES